MNLKQAINEIRRELPQGTIRPHGEDTWVLEPGGIFTSYRVLDVMAKAYAREPALKGDLSDTKDRYNALRDQMIHMLRDIAPRHTMKCTTRSGTTVSWSDEFVALCKVADVDPNALGVWCDAEDNGDG